MFLLSIVFEEIGRRITLGIAAICERERWFGPLYIITCAVRVIYTRSSYTLNELCLNRIIHGTAVERPVVRLVSRLFVYFITVRIGTRVDGFVYPVHVLSAVDLRPRSPWKC